MFRPASDPRRRRGFGAFEQAGLDGAIGVTKKSFLRYEDASREHKIRRRIDSKSLKLPKLMADKTV